MAFNWAFKGLKQNGQNKNTTPLFHVYFFV